MNWYQKMKLLRYEANMTTKEIAEYLNISEDEYCSYEEGKVCPNRQIIETLLRLYKISMEQLACPSVPFCKKVVYPEGMLDALEKSIRESMQISESWDENKQKLNDLQRTLRSVLDARSKAFDLPSDIGDIQPNQTFMTVHLDMRGEKLIEECFERQKKLMDKLYKNSQ